jgi:hypothetical protein
LNTPRPCLYLPKRFLLGTLGVVVGTVVVVVGVVVGVVVVAVVVVAVVVTVVLVVVVASTLPVNKFCTSMNNFNVYATMICSRYIGSLYWYRYW